MTEGGQGSRGKRKSLFPQEKKISINPIETKTPLLQESTNQIFMKKYGATPDVNAKKVSASSPREMILVQDNIDRAESEVPKIRPGTKQAYPIGITPKQLQPGYLMHPLLTRYLQPTGKNKMVISTFLS